MDKSEEIKKLKSLLDQGAITQDEFDNLKKNILNAPSEDQSTQMNSGKQGLEESQNQYQFHNQANLSGQKQVNYLAIICAGITAISVFLPWVEASSSVSWGGQHTDFSTGGISGISVGGGIFGIIMAIAGGILAYSNIKWASIFGAINFINGVGYAVGWFGINGSSTFSSSFGGGHMEAGVKPQFGLFIFIITSFLFMIFSFKSNPKPKYLKNVRPKVQDKLKGKKGLSVFGFLLILLVLYFLLAFLLNYHY